MDFSGTLEGIAFTRTRALALTSCEEVSMLPPGAYEDVFTSAFEFAGKINGQPIVVDLTYRGDTALGGEINAVFIASNDRLKYHTGGTRGVLLVRCLIRARIRPVRTLDELMPGINSTSARSLLVP